MTLRLCIGIYICQSGGQGWEVMTGMLEGLEVVFEV